MPGEANDGTAKASPLGFSSRALFWEIRNRGVRLCFGIGHQLPCGFLKIPDQSTKSRFEGGGFARAGKDVSLQGFCRAESPAIGSLGFFGLVVLGVFDAHRLGPVYHRVPVRCLLAPLRLIVYQGSLALRLRLGGRACRWSRRRWALWWLLVFLLHRVSILLRRLFVSQFLASLYAFNSGAEFLLHLSVKSRGKRIAGSSVAICFNQ